MKINRKSLLPAALVAVLFLTAAAAAQSAVSEPSTTGLLSNVNRTNDTGECTLSDQGLERIARTSFCFEISTYPDGEARKFIATYTNGTVLTHPREELTQPSSCAYTFGKRVRELRRGLFERNTVVKLVQLFHIFAGKADGSFGNSRDWEFSACGVPAQVAQACDPADCPRDWWQDYDCQCHQPFSPLILAPDLPGARFDLSTAEAGMLFDINSDGQRELIARPTHPDEVGFLYLPASTHDGGRLFGPNHKNGFVALAEWDEDAYGVPNGSIGPEDSIYNQLGVWRDYNLNGELYDENGAIEKTLAGTPEFQTLSALGIVWIGLDPVESNRTDGVKGNFKGLMGKFRKAGEEQSRFIIDYWAASKPVKNGGKARENGSIKKSGVSFP